MGPEVSFERKIQRAASLSKINGWSIAGFAALCTVVVLLMGDWLGVAIGLSVTTAGVMELRGHRLLVAREASAFSWLVGSQLVLMFVLWSYAAYQLFSFDSADPWARFSQAFKDLMLSINPDAHLVEALLRITFQATYLALILTVFIYQGGLAFYYFSRKKYLYAKGE